MPTIAVISSIRIRFAATKKTPSSTAPPTISAASEPRAPLPRAGAMP